MSDAIDLDEMMSTIDVDGDVESEANAGLSSLEAEDLGAQGDRDEDLSELAAGTEDDDPEDQGDDEESDDDEVEDDEEEEDPSDESLDEDDEPEADEPDDDPVAQLKAELAEERAHRKRMEQLLLQQQSGAPKPPQQQQPSQRQSLAFDPVFMSAIKAITSGAGPEKQQEVLGALPPHVSDAAINHVRQRYNAESYWIADPTLEFRDKGFAQLVQQQIEAAIQPLVEQRHQLEAQRTLEPYKPLLSENGAREQIGGLYDEIGSLDQAGRLKLAVELYKARTAGKDVAKKSRSLADKERDQKAKKRASRKRGGKRKSKKGKKALPEMDGFDAAKFAKQIKDMEIDPEEYQDLIA